MLARHIQQLTSIGLGGDGDEVDAIQAVEQHFGVALDYEDAGSWLTAGDVFSSLLKALPAYQRGQSDLWSTFAAVICDETGADASRVGPGTLLLA